MREAWHPRKSMGGKGSATLCPQSHSAKETAQRNAGGGADAVKHPRGIRHLGCLRPESRNRRYPGCAAKGMVLRKRGSNQVGNLLGRPTRQA